MNHVRHHPMHHQCMQFLHRHATSTPSSTYGSTMCHFHRHFHHAHHVGHLRHANQFANLHLLHFFIMIFQPFLEYSRNFVLRQYLHFTKCKSTKTPNRKLIGTLKVENFAGNKFRGRIFQVKFCGY